MSELRHVLKSQQFDRPLLEELFRRADQLDKDHSKESSLSGKLLFNVFYEPSTRTRMSFAAAAARLGMQVVGTENAKEFSSAAKGETLEDSVRVFCAYQPEAIVLRHFETGAAEAAAKVSTVPIINAGDGAGQHPTQALLDVYTVYSELGGIDGKTILVGGDLAHGRTARSFVYLLAKFDDIRLIFVS